MLTIYDVLGLRYISERLAYGRTAAVSFVGFAIGNTVAPSIVSAGAIRYRAYSRWGMDALEIAKVATFCSVTSGLGMTVLAGLGLLIAPDVVAEREVVSERRLAEVHVLPGVEVAVIAPGDEELPAGIGGGLFGGRLGRRLSQQAQQERRGRGQREHAQESTSTRGAGRMPPSPGYCARAECRLTTTGRSTSRHGAPARARPPGASPAWRRRARVLRPPS